MDKMEAMPTVFMKDPVFERLGKVARFAALNEKEKKAYRESLKVYRDNYAIAETERTIGRAEVARTMLNGGMDLEFVAKYTGFSIDELKAMKYELSHLSQVSR